MVSLFFSPLTTKLGLLVHDSVYINIKTGIAPVKINSAEYKGKS